MLCAISGEAPEVPVTSRKSGNVFERRLIEQYIRENGTDPVNGEELSIDDLLELRQPRIVKPRAPTQTSIPALLSSFQNEWDALILETYTLKQQLATTRQELSTALYYNDSAEKVIARFAKERDEARDALSKVTVSGANGHGDAMQVDGLPLPEDVLARISDTKERLSKTRRKRPVPETWVTPEILETFEPKPASQAIVQDPKSLSVDTTGDSIIVGGKGSAVVYSMSQRSVVHTLDCGKSSVLASALAGERPVLGLSSGSVKIFDKATELASFSAHSGAVTALALHPCGDVLASVGVDKSFVIYDLQTMKQIKQQYTDSDITCAAFHPDGHLFAIGTSAGFIELYDINTFEKLANFDSSTHGALRSICFSENGTWVATICKGQTSISIWDLRKLEQIETLEMGSSVSALAWDYTGQYLAACGPGYVAVRQYSKAAKAWSEPLRRAIQAVNVQWGANAQSLVVLDSNGAVATLSS